MRADANCKVQALHNPGKELDSSASGYRLPGIKPRLAPIRRADVRYVSSYLDRLLDSKRITLRHSGVQLIQRIGDRHWSVEWNLPRWLCDRAGLAPSSARTLVLANALGLAYIRLCDDRKDGELASAFLQEAIQLEDVLLGEARSLIVGLVGGDAHLEASINARMQAWIAAGESPAHFPDFDLRRLTHLADEGAPLFIVSDVIEAMTSNRAGMGRCETPVHNYLIAAVLYDHLKDWRSDLGASRRNYFISAMLGGEAAGMNPEQILAAVQIGLIRGDQLERYLDLIYQALAEGVESAQTCGLGQFARHLAALDQEAHRSGERLLSGMERMLVQATNLFGAS